MKLLKKIIKQNISDILFYKILFRKSHGYMLDIDNPKTLNEKIQWLKLNDRTKLHTICADKYLVRNYVKEKIGDKYLIDLLLFTKNVDDINEQVISKLAPCIIKTNHNSSGGIIIKQGGSSDYKANQEWLQKQLKINYYDQSREWQYKHINRGVIVERLLQTNSGEIPPDIKIHCFNGKVEFFEMINDRFSKASKSYYNTKWEILHFLWSSSVNSRNDDFSIGIKQDKPEKLDELIKLAEMLAKPFIYVRVDFYLVDGDIYFGELTFHPISGNGAFAPLKLDRFYGDKLDLSSLL